MRKVYYKKMYKNGKALLLILIVLVALYFGARTSYQKYFYIPSINYQVIDYSHRKGINNTNNNVTLLLWTPMYSLLTFLNHLMHKNSKELGIFASKSKLNNSCLIGLQLIGQISILIFDFE